jgi:hypothetical protein
MRRTKQRGPKGRAPPRVRLFACLALLLLGLTAGPPGARAAVLSKVLTGPGDTWDPSATVDATTSVPVFAWTLYRRGVPRAFVRVGTQPRLKMNRRGIGWAWSVDSSSSTAAYQQDRGGNSDVKFYDWQAQDWSSAGATVDTSRWEYEPALSGHWLVFGRLNRRATPDARRIVLENLQTGAQTVLDTFRGSRAEGMLSSPQIDGNWVTWASTSDRYQLASVHRYQISTGTSLRIPHAAGLLDYESAIGADGTVYFLQSPGGCGRRVTFESYSTSGVLTTLADMPAGRDGGEELSAEPQPGGSTDLYFDSYRCTSTTSNGNIYMLAVPSGAVGGGQVEVPRQTVRPAGRPKAFPRALRRRLIQIEGAS